MALIETEVIIVGGGPAGSSCAGQLRKHGIDCLILDKEEFPRLKLCAGWITPRVLRELDIDEAAYPHTLVTFKKLYYHFHGCRIAVKTRQHSIRRIEFDNWLLQRSGVPVHIHQAKEIRESGGRYVIDNRFSSSYLVGAAGTYCPVYRTIFQRARPRIKKLLVTTMEAEFQYDYRDDRCYLWFFDNKLSGYSWYVPKGTGRLNIGIGGKLLSLKGGRGSIRDHWRSFREKLNHLGLVRDFDFSVQGCNYFLHHGKGPLRIRNAFVVGDSAALASRDMGEGISAAVKSGILAAESIARQAPYTPGQVGRYSIFNIIGGKK
jgi:flavin-dependent dehydrogenase